MAHCWPIHDAPGPRASSRPAPKPATAALAIAPGPECPTSEPPTAETAIPPVAQSIGARRERPSHWNEPKPTVIAPPAATMPAPAWPASRPAARLAMIAAMHGNARRARSSTHSTRINPRSVGDHIEAKSAQATLSGELSPGASPPPPAGAAAAATRSAPAGVCCTR